MTLPRVPRYILTFFPGGSYALGSLSPRVQLFFSSSMPASVEGAQALLHMLRDVHAAAEYAKAVKDIEHAGDNITHRTLETLHKTFITPLDRDEIHQLISGMDDILDFVDATGQRIVMYDISGRDTGSARTRDSAP